MPPTLSKLGPMLARAARFTSRRPRESFIMLRMAFWVAALSLLVRFLPLSRALGLLTPRRRPAPAPGGHEIQTRLAGLLDSLLAADFWVFTPTCWKRAPVLHRFLALEGVETRVVFGVRKVGGDELDGHAWLEAGGEPVLETTHPDYKVTFSHPA